MIRETVDQFRPVSRLSQAVLGFATVACIQSEDGVVAIAAIKDGLAITDEEFEAAFAELHEDASMWKMDPKPGCFDHVQTGPTHALCIAALAPTNRPKPREWDRLRRLVIERDAVDGQSFCTYCNAIPDSIHIDHILALDGGGSNHPLNLVVACGFCNSSKGTKRVAEWLPSVHERVGLSV